MGADDLASRRATVTAAFIEDYNHFRDFGQSHEQIAQHLGIQVDSLLRKLKRLGVYRPDSYERRAQVVLDRLIASGEAFTADHLPCMADESLAKTLLSRATADKRIVKTGRRGSTLTIRQTMVNVYEGVAA